LSTLCAPSLSRFAFGIEGRSALRTLFSLEREKRKRCSEKVWPVLFLEGFRIIFLVAFWFFPQNHGKPQLKQKIV
jgi:hypothetical protein